MRSTFKWVAQVQQIGMSILQSIRGLNRTEFGVRENFLSLPVFSNWGHQSCAASGLNLATSVHLVLRLPYVGWSCTTGSSQSLACIHQLVGLLSLHYPEAHYKNLSSCLLFPVSVSSSLYLYVFYWFCFFR